MAAAAAAGGAGAGAGARGAEAGSVVSLPMGQQQQQGGKARGGRYAAMGQSLDGENCIVIDSDGDW